MSSQAGAKLRAALDADGLTVEEFAFSFGVTSKTVQRWLHGESVPRRKHARLLAERLGGHWTDYGELQTVQTVQTDHEPERSAA